MRSTGRQERPTSKALRIMEVELGVQVDGGALDSNAGSTGLDLQHEEQDNDVRY